VTPSSAPALDRVLVIVPAWNEEATLGAVLAEIHAAIAAAGLPADVLVVDDGSVDRTGSVAEASGVLVAHLPVNLGVGAAMRTGYRYARRSGYAVTVQVDADGQHNPADIPALLAGLADGADIVIGARVAGDGAYLARGPRRWAMSLLSASISRIASTRLTDTTSGFKACNDRAIDLFARTYPAEYLGDTVESLVVAARSHLVIRQVEVVMRPRAGGQPSHSPLRSAAFLGRAVLALSIALTRPRPELGAGQPRRTEVGA
jgi:glycosyltransferase involved in cell wall biosynthesis